MTPTYGNKPETVRVYDGDGAASAGTLRPGNLLRLKSGALASVAHVQSRKRRRKVSVVTNRGTYQVKKARRVWVHWGR